jgi:hypothetical protein
MSDLEELKKLIKENLKIAVYTYSRSSECSYRERTFVELSFMDEVISTAEIQKLGEDH